jgi:hypothetical protein
MAWIYPQLRLGVVLIKGKADVAFSFPVNCTLAPFCEDGDELLNVMGHFDGDSCWCGVWYFYVLWETIDDVDDLFTFGLIGEDAVASIVFGGWSDVPAINVMWVP